jgi:hypothetical protein
MKEILIHGSQWLMVSLNKVLHQANVKEALFFGNHERVSKNPTLLCKLVKKDIKFGFCMPLSLHKGRLIPGLLIAPMNIQDQNTIEEYSRIINKKQLTHDQSHIWGSNTSVDDRILEEFLMPCVYSCCLQRLINWTMTIDFKSAFCRYHLAAKNGNPMLQSNPC